MTADPQRSILAPGRNCWRVARASRLAWLVDGADAFAAMAGAIERARHSVLLLGWDLHSRVALRRGAGAPEEGFAELLNRVVRAQRGLRVNLLAWDFAMIYALEREALPRVRFGRTHRRVRFRLDGEHPFGASQHQKIVVVDDAVAFCGGLDITACRWDAQEHRPDDPRRNDPGFDAYGPFHDVQVAVEGEAAAALGELARERWRIATGETLDPVDGGDAWPEELAADARGVEVAIARTQPEWDDRPEAREVEALYIDALSAARRHVYIENQYFTSDRIADAIQELLERSEGPEILLVGPRACSGWLEEGAMGVRRARLLERLRAADAHGRLRVCHPRLPDPELRLNVHSKVLVVDDRFARVGSANLSNRSMGFDTECDLALESRTPEAEAAVASLRNRLLGEHLGVAEDEVARALAEHGSLLRAVDSLGDGGRTLSALDDTPPEWLTHTVPYTLPLDPEHPAELEEFVTEWLPGSFADEETRPVLLRLLAGVALVLGGVALWRATPLGGLVSPSALAEFAAPLRESVWGPIAAAAGFTLAATLMVPVVGLIAATGLLYGWELGWPVALAGSLGSAAAGYGLGAVLWRDAVRRLSGGVAGRLSQALAQRGILAVATLRVVPVAPFAVINLVAGASHIGFRDFVVGTLVGMAPGCLALVLTADRMLAAFRNPSAGTLLTLAAVIAMVVLAGWFARRYLLRQDPD